MFPITYNIGEVLEGYGTLKKLATSPRHVVPGHDPLVLARYPAAKPGLEGWIARLDVEPTRETCRNAQRWTRRPSRNDVALKTKPGCVAICQSWRIVPFNCNSRVNLYVAPIDANQRLSCSPAPG